MFAQRKLLLFFVLLSIILSVIFSVSAAVAQSGNLFAHPSSEIYAHLGAGTGVVPLTEANLNKLARPARAMCAGAYSCLSNINGEGVTNCAATGTNIFGAGECRQEEKSETYPCDYGKGGSDTCTRSWVEWTCQHRTIPRAGCTGQTYSTKGGAMTSADALNSARDSAAGTCCPCGGGDYSAIGASAAQFGRPADYKGYFCRC